MIKSFTAVAEKKLSKMIRKRNGLMRNTDMDMVKKVKKLIKKIPTCLERLVAAILMIAVLYACGCLAIEAVSFKCVNVSMYLQDILTSAFNIVIVIELIRMLVKHSMRTVVEGLIFAFARGLIVGRETLVQMVMSICAIAVMLICRRFLVHPYYPNDRKKTEVIIRDDDAEATEGHS